jgi:hypothetical protein
MRHKVGERVVAIRDGKDGKVFIYGHGVYEGDFPYEDVTSTEPLVRFSKAHSDYMLKALEDESNSLPLPNPRIRLDSGKIVGGCECWWGPEAGFEEKYGGGKAEIVEVSIDESKAECEGGQAHGIPDLIRGKATPVN